MFLIEQRSIKEKIRLLPEQIHAVLLSPEAFAHHFKGPIELGRDIDVQIPERHPPKKGLSFSEGQARLLHDLGSIELQAMELAFRTLCEFPEAPQEFREQLAALALSESHHLQLCLKALQDMGYQWGHWPIHTVLWGSVSHEDSILDRLLIVHRYLEGSGLDAGESLRRRLAGIERSSAHSVVETIVTEEVDHVAFGNRWYRYFCEEQKLDADHDFKYRFVRLQDQIPKRMENVNIELRKKAGFTETEIQFLQMKREEFLNKPKNAPRLIDT